MKYNKRTRELMLRDSVCAIIYRVRLTYCQHVCDIEKTFPIYFVLSLFKQKLGSISSSQQFIFSSTYWHLTIWWNLDIFPRVWCVKRFLVVFQLYLLPSIGGWKCKQINEIFQSEGGLNVHWVLKLTSYSDSWEKRRGGIISICFLPLLLDIDTGAVLATVLIKIAVI